MRIKKKKEEEKEKRKEMRVGKGEGRRMRRGGEVTTRQGQKANVFFYFPSESLHFTMSTSDLKDLSLPWVRDIA